MKWSRDNPDRRGVRGEEECMGRLDSCDRRIAASEGENLSDSSETSYEVWVGDSSIEQKTGGRT